MFVVGIAAGGEVNQVLDISRSEIVEVRKRRWTVGWFGYGERAMPDWKTILAKRIGLVCLTNTENKTPRMYVCRHH